MSRVDPIFAAVTAPATAFELTVRDGLRQFLRAAPDLACMIEEARRHGDKIFVVDHDPDGRERRITFEQMFRWRDALIPMLAIRPGDRVAICMRNRAEWMVAFLAIMRARGVAVLLNSRGSPDELTAMIEDATPALVLADNERAASLRASGYGGRLFDVCTPIECETAPPPPPAIIAKPEDPCAILFTSGTTGRAKGAILSHRAVITGLMGAQLSGVMVLHGMARSHNVPVETIIANAPPQATLLVYPLFHISGLGSTFLSPLLSGTKVVIMRRWNAAEAARLIAAERITQFAAVPTMLWDLLNQVRSCHVDLSSLRNIASGGQALPVRLLDEVRAAFPQAVMGTGFGMTETAGAFAQTVGEDFIRNRASAGRVLPLTDVRVVTPDGAARPSGESGEIQVRGAMVMTGYWNRPEATAAAFTEDGWLRTGDIGYLDDEGYIFIVDRVKDMVISGGENIYCAEVERVIGEMPGVVECATFGIADERLGELLVAIVVGEGIEPQAVIAGVGDRLARYKAPARVIVVREQLPRNHLTKIDKIALRAQWPALAGTN